MEVRKIEQAERNGRRCEQVPLLLIGEIDKPSFSGRSTFAR